MTFTISIPVIISSAIGLFALMGGFCTSIIFIYKISSKVVLKSDWMESKRNCVLGRDHKNEYTEKAIENIEKKVDQKIQLIESRHEKNQDYIKLKIGEIFDKLEENRVSALKSVRDVKEDVIRVQTIIKGLNK